MSVAEEISVKKSRGLMVLTVILGLVFAVGCSKEILKREDSVSEGQAAVAAQTVNTAEKSTQDTEAARKHAAQDQAVKEAAFAAREEAKKKKEAAITAQEEVAKNEERSKAANKSHEIYELADIRFDFDADNLKDEARASLKKDAEWLAKDKDVKIVIEGNCDERGTAEYNLALGERRAETAAKYLVSLGIDAKRIKTVSYGLENPLDPRHNEEAWAKNRRDHFVVTGGFSCRNGG